MKQSEAKSQQTRTCRVCNIEKPMDRFPYTGGYYRYKCKDCNNLEIHLRRKNNNDGFKEMANARLQRHRKTLRGALRQRFEAAKKRAKDLGLPLDIDLNFLVELYYKQDKRCAISGMELVTHGEFWEVLSIDRIIPENGYVKSNVQLVVNRINAMKSNLSTEDFIRLCRTIVEKGSETISKESTSQAIGDGSAQQLEEELMI